ncbi:hypothetical protein [Micromonospora vulcania]|uniref:DUF1700 domain-containing protein n=1 Tax=Micromonospora vulcania TaxID=1441873 RepID=A0ABW1H7Y8_9ACTN
MQDLDDVIAIAEHEWRSTGIAERDRMALANDLRAELEAAAADGVTPTQLLGDSDIRAFARNVAIEAGTRRLPYDIKRLLLTTLAGAAPGLAFAWLFLWWLPNAPYIGAIIAFVGALLTVKIRMSDVAVIGRTVWAMALLLPVAGILITPVTMSFAWVTGYSTAMPIVFLEAAIVAGALSAATILARRWALAPALGSHRLVASKGN